MALLHTDHVSLRLEEYERLVAASPAPNPALQYGAKPDARGRRQLVKHAYWALLATVAATAGCNEQAMPRAAGRAHVGAAR